MQRVAGAVLRLVRIDSSLIGFLAVFIPLLVRSEQVHWSFGHAAPLLLLWMCTFVGNDLHDIDTDLVNHPDRPLPSGGIGPTLAVLIYFSLLALTLLVTREFVDERTAFYYYALIALSISYGYVQDWLPSFKSVYVAALTALPIWIVSSLFPNDPSLPVVAIAVLLFMFGREVAMDILDRAGDVPALLHRLGPARLSAAAHGAQTIGVFLLGTQVRTKAQLASLAVLVPLQLFNAVSWFKPSRRRLVVRLMKLQLLVGLAFLL